MKERGYLGELQRQHGGLQRQHGRYLEKLGGFCLEEVETASDLGRLLSDIRGG